MVKIIGLLLIVSSLLSLFGGFYIGSEYGSSTQITGNVVSNILMQPKIELGFFDYFEAVAFSYSIASFIMGFIFLFRV